MLYHTKLKSRKHGFGFSRREKRRPESEATDSVSDVANMFFL